MRISPAQLSSAIPDALFILPNQYVAAYVLAIGVYLSVSIPSLRTIVDPVVNVDTREDRIEAMRILAAGNTIIMFLLGAVLCFQVSRNLVLI